MNAEQSARIQGYQRNEITEYYIYSGLAKLQKTEENRDTLLSIAREEMKHYTIWKEYTGVDVEPDRMKIWLYVLCARILGLTFAVKLMESGEGDAQEEYGRISEIIEEDREIIESIINDEGQHEEALVGLIDEEGLRYMGSVVLGLNDALVELTGAMAGLTFALRDTRLIALTGSITGIAAAFSMAASEYLSTKTEETEQSPLKAAVYTGVAYIFTVLALILPYLLIPNCYVALLFTLLFAVLIIGVFNYYMSVAKDLPFKKRFLEMAGLSLGVAGLSFLVGVVLRIFMGVDV